ncbi:MAG: nucleotidyltransferase domain-containing protein [bacterium]|nr:nucleotidyltransferase domain-containing protein [bacterium]
MLRQRVKEVARDVEADAEVILYGSRARGDARPDSDWDLLILVDGPVSDERKDAICHRLYELEWTSGQVLCPIVRSRQDWDSSLYRAMPFHQNVARDGIVL